MRLQLIREANRYAVIEKNTNRTICNILKRFDAAPAELDVSLKLFTQDGFFFDAYPDRIVINTNLFIGNVIQGFKYGLVIAHMKDQISVAIGSNSLN